MLRLGLCLWLIFASATVCAAPRTVPLKVEGDTVVVVKSLPCKVVASEGADFYLWSIPEAIKGTSEDNILTITQAVKGSYKVGVMSVTIEFSVDDKGKITKKVTKDRGEIEVVIGDVPQPPGPTPPGPTPGPSPIPLEGFRTLIIEDKANRLKLPLPQQEILFDKSVRDYLNAKCVVGEDGKTKEWRIWPHAADVTAAPKHWQDVMKRKRDSLPWIIISTGKTGYEGPLPEDVDRTLELLKKYGG